MRARTRILRDRRMLLSPTPSGCSMVFSVRDNVKIFQILSFQKQLCASHLPSSESNSHIHTLSFTSLYYDCSTVSWEDYSRRPAFDSEMEPGRNLWPGDPTRSMRVCALYIQLYSHIICSTKILWKKISISSFELRDYFDDGVRLVNAFCQCSTYKSLKFPAQIN